MIDIIIIIIINII